MFKKSLSLIIILAIVIGMGTTTFANDNKNTTPLLTGEVSVLAEAVELLDSLPNTQDIVAYEHDMIIEMLENNIITREDLNEELGALSHQSIETLQDKGYNDSQIKIIQDYDEDEDAFNHVFSPDNNVSPAATSAKVTFRYGLAGNNTRKTIKIAYDMRWSKCPFFTFTDSFGIGWIAADSNSFELVTKTDSSMAEVNYYDPSTDRNANLYRNVTMDKSTNGVVIGTPIIGSANGNYGKHIGGVTQISTQSNSSNIETIHLFVAYGHTTIAVSFDWEVVLEWKKVSGIISFIPRPRQDIIAKGDHTFRYNSQGTIIADIY